MADDDDVLEGLSQISQEEQDNELKRMRARLAQKRPGVSAEKVRERMLRKKLKEDDAAEEEVAQEVLGKMFRGKKCKKDCSGHKKGYNWKTIGKPLKLVKSASFEEGYKS